MHSFGFEVAAKKALTIKAGFAVSDSDGDNWVCRRFELAALPIRMIANVLGFPSGVNEVQRLVTVDTRKVLTWI